MSTTIKTGWLNDKNGDKFAPKTLTSQVQTSDGVLLEDKIQADLDAVKKYADSVASGAISTLTPSVSANTDSISSHTTAISNLQTAINNIQEITSEEISALFA